MIDDCDFGRLPRPLQQVTTACCQPTLFLRLSCNIKYYTPNVKLLTDMYVVIVPVFLLALIVWLVET